MYEITLEVQVYHGGSRNPTSYIQNVERYYISDGVLTFSVNGKVTVVPISILKYLKEV